MWRIENAKKLNTHLSNWKMLKVIIVIQLAVILAIALDFLYFTIPIFREVISFVYLTFIPGLLIFLIIQKSVKSLVEMFLYSIGISIPFIIFIGFLMNFLYPLVGISEPITEIPLITTITFCVLVLLAFCYTRRNSKQVIIGTEGLSSPYHLSLLFIPFLSIFGTHLLNLNGDNILLILLILVISIMPVLIAIDKVPEDYYPLAIWVISLSLLFYNSLVLNRVPLGYPGFLIKINGLWNPTLPFTHNSLLAQNMPFAIYSIVGDINLLFVSKIIYPFLFSIVPVALYKIYETQLDKKISFLSCYLFMSTYFFILIFSENIRSGMALFFIVLFVLTLVNKNISNTNKRALAIIFVFCVAISHYGASYILLIALAVVLFVIFITGRFKNTDLEKKSFTSNSFVILFFIFTVTWYLYTSSSKTFEWFLNYTSFVVSKLQEEFISAEHSYALQAAQGIWPSLAIMITKYLFMIVTLLILVGVVEVIIRRLIHKKELLEEEFTIYSIAFFGTLVATLLPTGSTAIGRPYQIALSFLAPFGVIGGLRLLGLAKTLRKRDFEILNSKSKGIVILSVFFSIFLLFNSGVISEVITKDYSPVTLISKNRIMKSNITEENIHEKMYFYTLYSPTQDIYSSEWFLAKAELDDRVYRDYIGGLRLSSFWPSTTKKVIEKEIKLNHNLLKSNSSLKNDYVYLGYHNYINGVVLLDRFSDWYRISEISPKLEEKEKIYINGGSVIYR